MEVQTNMEGSLRHKGHEKIGEGVGKKEVSKAHGIPATVPCHVWPIVKHIQINFP